MKKQQAFTLIELAIVMAIIVILASVGFPGLKALSSDNRLMTNANNIIASFHQARSEALKRSVEITVRAKTDSGVTAWENGWEVVDTAPDPDVVLADYGRLPSDMTAAVTNDTTSYRYNAQGRLANINANNQIVLCDSRTGEKGRQITLTLMGRLSVDRVDCP